MRSPIVERSGVCSGSGSKNRSRRPRRETGSSKVVSHAPARTPGGSTRATALCSRAGRPAYAAPLHSVRAPPAGASRTARIRAGATTLTRKCRAGALCCGSEYGKKGRSVENDIRTADVEKGTPALRDPETRNAVMIQRAAT